MPLIYTEEGKTVARILNVRCTGESDFGDCVDYCYTIKVVPGVELEELKAALRYSINTHCTHAYDCCGHWYYTAYAFTLRHAKRREFTLTVAAHQNI